jgi:hypothetical protein
MQIPDSVQTERQRALYEAANELRRQIKAVAETADALRHEASVLVHTESLSTEVPANATLTYRCLEDASMRLGKVLQAIDGGVSVYDKATTVGT